MIKRRKKYMELTEETRQLFRIRTGIRRQINLYDESLGRSHMFIQEGKDVEMYSKHMAEVHAKVAKLEQEEYRLTKLIERALIAENHDEELLGGVGV